MSTAPTRIGIIVGSQRVPRAGLQISHFVHDAIHDLVPVEMSLSLIDLGTWNLPLCDEPGIPSLRFSASKYAHPHTRAWSAEVSSYDAFIFVTPQYNWGYPAGLKNAIDYLYNEWKGKPALIVSYGGHGGGKAAEQLKQVLHGVRMRPVEKTVGLTFPDRAFMVEATLGKDLRLRQVDENGSVWVKERDEIRTIFGDLLVLLNASEQK